MEKLLVTPTVIAQNRVFLRADLNVPLAPAHFSIADDYRLRALLPTLRLLVQNAASVIIATHLGKPDPDHPDEALSTKHLLAWFTKNHFSVSFASSAAQARELIAAGHSLILLENLRFFKGEQEPSTTFAAELATLADVYVNDAFGTLHRSDASIALLPLYFPREKRFYGYCIAHEIKALNTLRQGPVKPFVALIGGNKLTTKLPLIQQLITAPPTARVTAVLLGGLLGLDLESSAPDLLKLARENGVSVLTPIDYLKSAPTLPPLTGRRSELKSCISASSEGAESVSYPIDIGPQTIALFTPYLAQAQTIFANGTMGKYEEKAGQTGTNAMLAVVGNNAGFTVIGGGDCGAAAAQCGVAEKVSFVSTGGGATLAFIASKEPWHDLPGLKALITVA